MERREPSDLCGMWRGAKLAQQLHRAQMAIGSGEVKSCLASSGVRHINSQPTMIDEASYSRRPTGSRRIMQRLVKHRVCGGCHPNQGEHEMW